MLERQLHLAQDFIENAPRHPQHQSREAGSCLGAIRPFEVLRRNFGNPPYVVILCNPAGNRSRPIPGAQNRLQKNAT